VTAQLSQQEMDRVAVLAGRIRAGLGCSINVEAISRLTPHGRDELRHEWRVLKAAIRESGRPCVTAESRYRIFAIPTDVKREERS